MAKVCLIDGSGYIFRAFYALPTMTAPNGKPVNAVYGFLTMFMRLIKAIPCDYCAVLFDAKRQNFRNNFFADYKATRAEIPELLIPQFELIYKTVQNLNLPYILQEGYEADDLIATYAKQAVEAGHDVVVVSADKDLMQLIRPHVEFYDGMKDKFFTPEDVHEKFGVYPDKVVDVQALSGDKIDNIPGVPGIGPKTAAELVNMFGSLQGVLDNADKIKQNKRREVLMQNKEAAELSLKLVTLKNDVPVEHQLNEFKCQAPDAETLLDFVTELGFKSILPKLQKWIEERCCALGGAPIAAKKEEPARYLKIQNRDDLKALYQEIVSAQQFGFQVLHNGVEPEALSVCTKENSAYYLPIPQVAGEADLFSHHDVSQLDNETVKKFLLATLENPNILKIALDLKTQWHYLNKICGKQLDLWPYHDVAVMSYDVDSSLHEHTLAVLSDMLLDKKIAQPKLSAKIKKIDFPAGYSVVGGAIDDNCPSSSITMQSGTVNILQGGSDGDGSVSDVSIVINGGTIKSVVGGGYPNLQYSGKANHVGAVHIVVNDLTGKTGVFGGGYSYASVGDVQIDLYGGAYDYVTAGGSNGSVASGTVNVYDGQIDVLEGTNHGFVGNTYMNINGGSIGALYAGMEPGDEVIGTIGHAQLELIGGNVSKIAKGQNGTTEDYDNSYISGYYYSGVANDDEATVLGLSKKEKEAATPVDVETAKNEAIDEAKNYINSALTLNEF